MYPPGTTGDSLLAPIAAPSGLGRRALGPVAIRRWRSSGPEPAPTRAAAVPAVVAAPADMTVELRACSERVRAMLETLERCDAYTAAHCTRVAALAELIADGLCLRDEVRRRHLLLAALLHDVGKIDVPIDVLHKPGRLEPAERAAIEAHVEAGVRRTGALGPDVRTIIAQHHERIDGAGYPCGLRGAAIRLEARIVAVADAFDALTSDRPYRRATDARTALAELVRSARPCAARQQFDPFVVDALARCFDRARRLCADAIDDAA